jgi:hypothetical protein
MMKPDATKREQTKTGPVAWPLGYIPDSEKPPPPDKIPGYERMTFEQKRAAQWSRQRRA